MHICLGNIKISTTALHESNFRDIVGGIAI